jgi:hypothetical protein
MLPASDFGHRPEDLTTRIALVDFDGGAALDALKSGAELNDDFLGRHCPKVLDGLDHLADWLGGP